MIEQIEKALGLRVDWRAYEHLRKQYSWLLDLSELDLDIDSRNHKIEELEEEVNQLDQEVQYLQAFLDQNGIEYD